MIRKIRLLIHQPYDATFGKCWACRKPWPCSIALMLRGDR